MRNRVNAICVAFPASVSWMETILVFLAVIAGRMLDPLVVVACLVVAFPLAAMRDAGLRTGLMLAGAFVVAALFTALGARLAVLDGKPSYPAAATLGSYLVAAGIDIWLIRRVIVLMRLRGAR